MPLVPSPKVVFTETDYTQVVPFGSTGEGLIVGNFTKGPIMQPVLISSTTDLEEVFGTPTDANYKEWYCAWNFLQYSGSLWVTRVKPTGVKNAAVGTAIDIINFDAYMELTDPVVDASITAAGKWICKQPGAMGNNIQVVMVDSAVWEDLVADAALLTVKAIESITWAADVVTVAVSDHGYSVGDIVEVSNVKIAGWDYSANGAVPYNGKFEIASVTTDTFTYALDLAVDPGDGATGYGKVKGVPVYMAAGRHLTQYFRSGAPGTSVQIINNYGNGKNDELHIAVIDKTGVISGTAGTVLEVHEGLSKATDVTDYLGRNIYYANYLNTYSDWLYFGIHTTDLTTSAGQVAWGLTSSNVQGGTASFKVLTEVQDDTLAGGVAGTLSGVAKISALQDAYELFTDKDKYSVMYAITVDYPIEVLQFVNDSVSEVRRDMFNFVSPHNDSSPFLNKTTLVQDLSTFRDVVLNPNSAYTVIDSGYKYQWDGFNQKYRWIPLNGDVAGICARLDSEYEAWYSPGGSTRGKIKNAVKLSSNLNEDARDILYPKQINAVVSSPGEGTFLLGDRTSLSNKSAFQSFHIKKLFIILEKSISKASKSQLFEFNNPATRSRFVGMVEPFLRSVQSRDGLEDYKVVCDASNNTDDVIARGEFVASIYIKPLYSIQGVILNFVATKSSVQFNQLIGNL